MTADVREGVGRCAYDEATVGATGETDLFRALLGSASEGILAVDARGTIVFTNAASASLFGYDPADLVGESLTTLIPDSLAGSHSCAFSRYLATGERTCDWDDVRLRGLRRGGEEVPISVSFREVECGDRRLFVGLVRDDGERRRRERELAAHCEELARLNRVNRVIRRTNRALVDAERRSEIERAVCERLIDADPYVFAWMGSVNRPGERVVPEVWAGAEDGYLDDISIPLSGDAAEGPTARAVRTREAVAIQDLETDETYAPWREHALERGYRSSVAIPVVFEDRLFGVLCLYADASGAFDTEEREVLAELGRTVGHAINALERKEALMSDSVLEVDFRCEAVSRMLPDAVAEAGTVTFDRIVPATDDRYLQYVTITDVEADRVAETVLRHPTYEDARCIREDEEECAFELHALDPPVTSLVATYGGRVADVAVDRDELRVTARLPMQTDVRQFVDALRERVPDAELVSQRTVPRRSHTPDGIRVSLEEELTERQRTTVETAYYAGYFNWPRDSTAEEVADRLDVSSPTVHKHLRAAEQKILRTILE